MKVTSQPASWGFFTFETSRKKKSTSGEKVSKLLGNSSKNRKIQWWQPIIFICVCIYNRRYKYCSLSIDLVATYHSTTDPGIKFCEARQHFQRSTPGWVSNLTSILWQVMFCWRHKHMWVGWNTLWNNKDMNYHLWTHEYSGSSASCSNLILYRFGFLSRFTWKKLALGQSY